MRRQILSDWNSSAMAYEQYIASADHNDQCIEWPCIRQMLPALRDKRVLDLGCGTGQYTFLLEKEEPKYIIGIDLSDQMLLIAREKAEANGSSAVFIRGDARRAYLLAGSGYDLVFSSTTTHYIRDLEDFLMVAARCMRPGGMCILSVIHPVCSAQYPVDGDDPLVGEAGQLRYLGSRLRVHSPPWKEKASGGKGLSHSFHHTFGDYVNAALRVGLTLLDVQEPMPPEGWKASMPDAYERCLNTPPYLILKFTK